MKPIDFSPPTISNEEINAVVKAMKSGWLSMGPLTHKFENNFARKINAKNAVAVNSCTAALHLALLGEGVGKGDEVITTPLTFASTTNMIEYCQAKPVFADIDPDTFNLDPSLIEEKISSKTKAILPVHYGGVPCDMDPIIKIAKKHNLAVIEDAAHAIGSKYKGKYVGSSNTTACFSFYPTKNITTGEGGMITTPSAKKRDLFVHLRLHGISKDAWKRYTKSGSWKYDLTDAGYKYNMSDINAAIGIEQLKKLDSFNKARKKISEYYVNSLPESIVPQDIPKYAQSSYHLFAVQTMKYPRDKLVEELKKKGVMTSVHFIPLHLQTFYKNKYRLKKGDFPIAESVYKNLLSLPLYPQLSKVSQERIVKAIKSILK